MCVAKCVCAGLSTTSKLTTLASLNANRDVVDVACAVLAWVLVTFVLCSAVC